MSSKPSSEGIDQSEDKEKSPIFYERFVTNSKELMHLFEIIELDHIELILWDDFADKCCAKDYEELKKKRKVLQKQWEEVDEKVDDLLERHEHAITALGENSKEDS